ncbi:hypothetical protein [Streptomyces sp. NPDC006368]
MSGFDLSAALVADPERRAVDVPTRAGVDLTAVTARVDELSQQV